MNWEELTAPDFEKAVRKCQRTCLVPLGCIEKHGEHLPLGADVMQVRAIAQAAAEIEPVVVFPEYYFTQISCARHQPGTVAINERLMFELLENVCNEIARNGFEKIVLLNGHGGNEDFLVFFTRMMTHLRENDFYVYCCRLGDFWGAPKMPAYKKLRESEYDGHAGETETSLMLKLFPELVHMSALPEKPGLPMGRTKHLPLFTGLWWYADYPDHYCGDGRRGTVRKGAAILADGARNVAKIVRAVKRDRVVPRLQREFHARSVRPGGAKNRRRKS